jgi:MOSC domain-containing protein YiiM
MPALPPSAGVLKAAGRINAACAGVYAQVLRPGRIRVGDAVRI